MGQPLIVHGRYSGRQFIPTDPLPLVEGTAELKILPLDPPNSGSIADAFGKVPHLRTGDDIAAQLREERDAWGDR